TWLIDSRGFAKKVKNNGVSSGHEIKDCGANRQCPNCDYHIHNTDITTIYFFHLIQDWPGFPAGVKFDPSDVELLQHLAAKCGTGDLVPHVLIDEFIPTLDGGEGICYTHPENLPGAKKDGSSVHFFYKIVNAYASGKRKRRRIQDKESTIKARVRWHKTGKTKPLKEHGIHIGYKKIMVLYTTPKPDKCHWVMHQYHLGSNIDEREGEYVVSKIFYQPSKEAVEKTKTSLLISESNMGTVQVIPRPPTTNTPYTCREEKTQYSDCTGSDNYSVQSLVQNVKNLKEKFHPSCTSGSEYQMEYASCSAGESGALDLIEADFPNIDTRARFGDFKSNYASLIQVESNASFGIGDLDYLELDTPPDFQLSDLEFASQDSLFD
ncbi:hypothetical protein RD792_010358, partial [Penstemon davidsonii]